MNLSTLIKALNAAQEQYGDVPVMLMDEESGNWHPLAEVLKLHPYTAPHGCLNRAEPVNAIAMSRNGGNTPDLVLANTKDQEHRMSDETTPQDDAAMPPASTGSVCEEPVAWAIQWHGDSGPYIDWDLAWPTREQAENFMSDCTRPHGAIVPLYRHPQPTLTEAEREVLLGLACHCDTRSGGEWHRFSAVVRGLLERTKGGGE